MSPVLQGMFVKHIQNETGTRVQIKGQGSGYYEVETGREGEDPMHISIASVCSSCPLLSHAVTNCHLSLLQRSRRGPD